jgi:hypothetical protein
VFAIAVGAALLLTAPAFAQNAPASSAGSKATPTEQAAPVPTTPPTTTRPDKAGTYIEPTRGHEVTRDPATGRQKMVTPTGKHDKM